MDPFVWMLIAHSGPHPWLPCTLDDVLIGRDKAATIVYFVIFSKSSNNTHGIYNHSSPITPISVCFAMSEQPIEPITDNVRDFVPYPEKYK